MSTQRGATERTPTRPEDLPEGVAPILPACAAKRTEKRYHWHIGDGSGEPRCSYVEHPVTVDPAVARQTAVALCGHCARQVGDARPVQRSDLLDVDHVGPRRAEAMFEIGIKSLADLRAASADDVAQAANIDYPDAVVIAERARRLADAPAGGDD